MATKAKETVRIIERMIADVNVVSWYLEWYVGAVWLARKSLLRQSRTYSGLETADISENERQRVTTAVKTRASLSLWSSDKAYSTPRATK